MVPQQYIPVVLATAPPLVQPTLPVVEAPSADIVAGKQKKGVRCWKCAVNTHTTKDCKFARQFTTVWFVILIIIRP
jgi:hypothetical protein